MKEMILLGAGASVEAGVPGAFEMTRKLIELFGNNPMLSKHSKVLRFAVGGLLFQQGINGNDPFTGVNVEDLFNAIQLLAGRQELEAAPFIGSWHPLVEGLDRINPKKTDLRRLQEVIYKSVTETMLEVYPTNSVSSTAKEIDQTIEVMSKGGKPSKKLGKLLSEMIKSPFEILKTKRPRYDSKFNSEFSKIAESNERPGEGQVFQKTTEIMTQMLAEIVWLEDPSKVCYLLPLFYGAGEKPLTIATLNYDNAIELAAASANIPIEIGIEGWSQSGQFPQIEKGIKLLKLHGSIDWSVEEVLYTIEKPLPHQITKKVSAERIKEIGFKPAVIFGQRNKLTAKGPFLNLLRTFEQELDDSERLTVIGYSFRDEHINEFIAKWLNEDQNKKLRIINGKRFKDTNIPFAHTMLNVLGERLDVIPSYAKDGIKACFAQ